MTVQEVKAKKLELEKSISQLVVNFEKDTGVSITDIEINKVDFFFEDKSIVRIIVRCELA